MAENDVADAGLPVVIRRRARRADDEVVEAVAVDVAGAAHRGAEAERDGRVGAVDDEAVLPVEARQIEARAEATGPAEHHVGAFRVVEIARPDDDISITVA